MADRSPIPAFKIWITDRIHENHERKITGIELQEILHDMLDTLGAYIDGAIIEPARNYYVNEIQIDGVARTITLVRAGGADPVNISASLKPLDNPEGVVNLVAGDNPIVFGYPLPAGTPYEVLKLVLSDDGGFDIGGQISLKTHEGFTITVDEAATLTYRVIR